MKTPPSDEDLRQRLQELGRREAATAPGLARVLRGRRPAAGWLRPAVALAGVFLVVAVVRWWPLGSQGGGTVVAPVERASNDPAEEWILPTDTLLAEAGDGAGGAEVERLSREIEGLLQP
jgi:hypothetical protein